MGTRGAFGFRVNQQDFLTYNHFDSYPSGLGQEIVDQLKPLLEANSLDTLRKMAAGIRLVKESDKPTPEDIEIFRNRAGLGVRNQNYDDWYCLLRNFQGQLVETLVNGVMIDSSDFMLDSLFCEYAYVVNLDTEELEIYEGFQREPHLKGRYGKWKQEPDEESPLFRSNGYDYFPVALKATIAFNKLFGIETLAGYLHEKGLIQDDND